MDQLSAPLSLVFSQYCLKEPCFKLLLMCRPRLTPEQPFFLVAELKADDKRAITLSIAQRLAQPPNLRVSFYSPAEGDVQTLATGSSGHNRMVGDTIDARLRRCIHIQIMCLRNIGWTQPQLMACNAGFDKAANRWIWAKKVPNPPVAVAFSTDVTDPATVWW